MIDAMSVWQAVSAIVVREPAEKGLGIHIYWLREKLDRGQLHRLRWVDTRDMHADAHTKGSIPRDVIIALMSGNYEYAFEYKDFVSPALTVKERYESLN